MVRSRETRHLSDTRPRASLSSRRVAAPPQPAPASLPLSNQALLRALSQERLPRSVSAALAEDGRPLDPWVRARMERRFGRNLDGVRVHTSEAAARSADQVEAAAYTVGRHVVFGAGRYDTATGPGLRLLAHELAHVVQPAAAAPALRRFHLPHGSDPKHQQDETPLIAGTYAAMLTTIKAIITASISYGTTVDMDHLVLNAGGLPVSKKIDRELGTHSTPKVASMLQPRYLLTRRAGLLDMRHFVELMYISHFTNSVFLRGGNRAATEQGREHELTSEAESRFGAEDTVSNAIGAYTGTRLAAIPQSDDLFDTIKDMLDRTDPVDFAALSTTSKDKVRHFYGDLVPDPAPKKPGDLIPAHQNSTALPDILDLPEFAGSERSFPFELDTDDPDRKTISDTAFGGGAAGLTGDSEIRKFVSVQRPEVIRSLKAAEKVRLVRRLFSGWVSDGDVDAIVIIYRNSTADERRQIRAAIDVDDLWSDDQVARLNSLFST